MMRVHFVTDSHLEFSCSTSLHYSGLRAYSVLCGYYRSTCTNLSQSTEKERVLLSMWPCNGQLLLLCFPPEFFSDQVPDIVATEF